MLSLVGPLASIPSNRWSANKRRAARGAAGAALFVLAAEALATGCGSKTDLIIGRNLTSVPEGSAGTASAGSAGKPNLPDAGPADCGVEAPTAIPGLMHRYSFEGTGWLAKDSVGTDDGELLSIVDAGMTTDAGTGAVLDGTGQLVLDGNTGYVDLPNYLISKRSEVTIVTWVKWAGGSGYQRIFDFGVGVAENDTSGQGKSYLALSPWGAASRLMVLTKSANTQELKLTSTGELNDGQQHQVAVVFASSAYTELYRDGVQLARANVTFPLSDIEDVDDWIGRSQWKSDNPFNGSIDEFRIYGRALSACEIQALNVAGPNAL